MHAKKGPRQLAWPWDLAGDSPLARALLPTAILAATFLAYVATLDLGFVFDDPVLILTNDSIRSWRFFPSYFASHIWISRYPHLFANYYRPLFLTWLRLNDALFGLHPWGWHLTSTLAHVAVTCLVYRLCVRLTRDAWVAGIAALIFGLHIVHAEAVAYVASIQEPISTFFILAVMLTFCRSRESGHKLRWLAASLALTAGALLSKESGMVLPILVGGFAWIYYEADGGVGGVRLRSNWVDTDIPSGRSIELTRSFNKLDNLRRSWGSVVMEVGRHLLPRARSALAASIPYWLVILVYITLRIWALKGFAYVVRPVSLSTEVFTIPSVLVFYLRLLVWPVGLSCYYDTPYVGKPSWQGFVLPIALLAVIVAAGAVWYWRTSRRAPHVARTIAFASLWMILTLLPVLNFRFLPAGEIAHDRYIYLPSVGFVLLVAITLRQAAGTAGRFSPQPAWALGGALVFSAVMGIATARQCLFWSDDLVLSVRSHAIAPHSVSATTSLAAALGARGMEGKAMTLYQQALSLQPDYWVANRNLGYLYYNQGNYPEAARLLIKSLQVGPDEGDQFFYLGMALLRMGRPSEAEKSIRAALLLRPQGKNYHLGLGMVMREEGKLVGAKREVETELASNPQNAQAQALLKEVDREIHTTP